MTKSKEKNTKPTCKCGYKKEFTGKCPGCGIPRAGKNSEKLPDDAKGANPS